MRVLVTGAYGFIGSAVAARLAAEGHEVVALGRNIRAAAARRPDYRWIALDIAKATTLERWLPHLAGVDAVVNCAGALQDNPGDDVAGVHLTGMRSLFEACARVGVRRFVQISAIGVEANTKFARTKREADDALIASDLDWIVLRPSIVVGRSVYGGTALIRALAALPFLPSAPRDPLLQPVQVHDLAEAVAFFVRRSSPPRNLLEVAGPERIALSKMVAQYRQWLGYAPAKTFPMPAWIEAAIFRLGDAASWLGWRPPVRTTALKQLQRDVTGDCEGWTSVTGIRASSLGDALATDPASVQERWFAKLFLLKPVLIAGLALFWIATGLLTLGPAREAGVQLLVQAGFGSNGALLAIAGAILDVLIGAGIAIRKWSRAALWLSVLVSFGYLALGGILLPQLWADPLGPLLKIVPVLLASFATLAILDDR